MQVNFTEPGAPSDDLAAHRQLPFLTRDVAPVPAACKRHYEDFIVTEQAMYPAAGEGTHCFFQIEKSGLSTHRAVSDIARALGVPTREIGLAGLKDARGVTTQMLSVEHIDPERIRALDIPRIRVVSVDRHVNKLKIGHLAGNHFRIKLREIDAGRLPDIRSVCDILSRRGVPNYFGQQRFGSRGDTWRLGAAILRRDDAELLDLMLGRPGPHDVGDVLRGRQLYETGDFGRAARTWPRMFHDNARALRILEKTAGDRRKAARTIPPRMRTFFVNAFQSHLFNQVLARRIDELDSVHAGDLAWKHDTRAVFRVEDEAAEAPRAAAFEISPTGPLFGNRMSRPSGRPDEIEQSVLAASGFTEDDLRRPRGVKLYGTRRPFRFCLHHFELADGGDEHGPYVELAFGLAAGCYATMVLREICKDPLVEGRAEDEE